MDDQKEILNEYANKILNYYKNEEFPNIWYPMYFQGQYRKKHQGWVKKNWELFLKGTPNDILFNRWYSSELGAITALIYSPSGSHIITGHASGLIQMRHGSTGVVLCTLRNIQFPPKPIYALEYSHVEERVCYAACMDGAVYRIEIPNLNTSLEDPPEYCIRADPALECLNTQFYGSPGISSCSTPLITQRSAALALGLTADHAKMVVGYADTSIKVYDMETLERTLSAVWLQLSRTDDPSFLTEVSSKTTKADLTYKVHKLRLQFIPRKLQRMHFGQVCALRCHDQRPNIFASGAWDSTLRKTIGVCNFKLRSEGACDSYQIWDTRCQVGCVMTFEGVNVCANSIDLNRNNCIVGSWQPTEALTTWDLVAKKKLHTIRVQNRRPDVDGEYIYACRYWRSKKHNRKGKYGIIGGSGTNCVEVINLHNRYITCSYPAPGTILAITSHNDKIAFGGTAPVLNIVSFHDPKHEKYKVDDELEYDYTVKDVTWFDNVSSTVGVEPSSQIKPTSAVSNVLSSLSQRPSSSVSQRPLSATSQRHSMK